MSIIPDLIFNVAVLFVMLVPGIVMQKCKLVPAGFGKGISNLVLYIAQPILIVSAYVNCKSSFGDIWQNILWVFILSIIAHVIFAAVALNMFGRTEDGRRRILRLVTIFANAAFMGIPLIEALLDAEAAIYASIYNITFNLFLWTLGVFLCTRNSDEDMDGDGDSDVFDDLHVAKKVATKEVSISKVILHPVTIASVIGVILLVTGANTAIGANLASEAPSVVIEFIVNCLNMIKGLVAPLSMVVIGLRLAEVNFKGLFKVLVGIMRLLMLVGVPISEVCLLVVTILAATPAASSATMFAEKYDCDAGYASKLVAVSTILCILTMPVVVMIAQLGL